MRPIISMGRGGKRQKLSGPSSGTEPPPPSTLEELAKKPLPPLSPETLAARLYLQLEYNPLLWGHYFFPHHFRIKAPAFHLQMSKECIRNRFLAVASPRESAKSTILTFNYPFHQVVFRKKRFIVIVQNTFKKAALSLDTMKREVKDNTAFQEIYPGLTISKDAEGDSVFRHADGFQTLILCKGVDQIGSIRGVKFGAYRPDLIICDDMEDDKMVQNPDLRRELQSLYDEALIPAGEKGHCQYVAVGTVLNDDSQLARLVSKEHYPEYKKLFYQAHIHPFEGPEHGERSLWPEKWSVDYLREMARTKMTVYAKEYQNDPVAGKSAKFRKDDFRLWRMAGDCYELLDEQGQIVDRGVLSSCKAAIACDLAWSEKREADSTVLMPGFLTPRSDLLVDTYIHETGLRPDQVSEALFSMESRLRNITGSSVPIGFEKSMLENVTQWILRTEMRRRNQFLWTRELEWDMDKEKRIQIRLQPRYAQHVLYHRSGMGTLEQQLLRFPSGSHDDLPDALQGLVQLLQYPRHSPPPATTVDPFMRLRQTAIDARRPPAHTLFSISGSREPFRGIRAIQSPL